MGLFDSEMKVFRKSVFLKTGIISALLCLLVWSSSVSALGMGAATAETHIGEPLSVHIPIFNVKDPNNLSVILQRTDEVASSALLQARVEHINFQLGIRIESEKPTTEPYISFVLEVVDGSDVSSKEFTVLLDLNPNSVVSSQSYVAGTNAVGSNVNTKNNRSGPLVFPASNRVSSLVPQGNILGPYDWAKAGQVPESFGPVLDGQSLWRVARRINQALGVSIDQVMWSLYELNPEQFSTNSITSLKAGAILKIPTAAQASKLTERQAKERVSAGGRASPVASANSPASSISSVTENKEVSASNEESVGVDVVENEQEQKITQPFNLTSLNGDGSLIGSGESDTQSQQIIASLAEAVGNLTQEVIKKDKKISFLEEKLAAFEEFKQVGGDSVVLQNSARTAEGDVEGSEDAVQADVVVPSNQADNAVLESSSAVKNEPLVKQDEVQSTSLIFGLSIWQLLLIVLLLLVVVGLIFRQRIMDLLESLNLLGAKNNEIEFDPTMFEHTESIILPAAAEDPDLTVENNNPKNGLSQSSILEAIKTAVQTDDPLSPQTLMDLESEFSYTEMLSKSQYSVNEDDLTFMQRYEKALNQRDFGYARQLLDFARESELDLPNYHYQRLRLYQVMHDEDEFYDYYCEVEQLVSSFKPDLQTEVSKLVLKMAQH